VETGAGEPWARVEAARGERLAGATRGIARHDLASAAYLVGAGLRQLDVTAAYVAERHQFGRPVGDRQAVAHPLADAWVDLQAADALACVAAARDSLGGDGRVVARQASLAAGRAALRATYAAHQAMGAIGFAVEGPTARHSLLIRQCAVGCGGRGRRGPLVEALGLDRLDGLDGLDGGVTP